VSFTVSSTGKFRRPFRHGPEELEMIAFFDYCRAMAHLAPEFALAFHVPNESKSSIPRRKTLKRAGLKKGVPDICVPVPRGKYAALYIEMKVKPNKPSPEQIQLIAELNAVGNYAVVCWSADEAIQTLLNYMAGKCPARETSR